MKHNGEYIRKNHKWHKGIVAEFKRMFYCDTIGMIVADSVDYYEQDMIVYATLYENGERLRRVSLFMQFNSDGSITKGSGS